MKIKSLTIIICAALALTGCVEQNYQTPQVIYAKPIDSQNTNVRRVVRRQSNQQQRQVSSSSTTTRATPVTINYGDSYTVKPGDTLYSIAFRSGMDYRELAKLNGIGEPYNISVGQSIRLSSAPSAATVTKNVTTTKTVTVTQTQPNSATSTTTRTPISLADEVEVKSNKAATTQATSTEKVSVVTGSTRTVSGITWMWPTRGNVLRNFSSTNKGIDIVGTQGQNINAAADGQVVYSGNALRGYGNLIIINHSNEFLSAYAHNDVLLVKEGQKIKRGQVIARMGKTDADRVMLHFEIRYKGNSVNPRTYLPK